MVYFHGGSWSEGKPDWFFYSCRSDAKNGWVACAVEYRLYGRQGATPFDAVKDARSAIRWLRQHAKQYGIDTDRIVASGNSAGGHLALTAALAEGVDEPADDLSCSPMPNLLLVNSGVFDLTGPSWFNKKGKDSLLMKKISPTFLVRKGMPPVLIIHGTSDGNVPYATAAAFAAAMTRSGNAFEFRTIEGAHHFIWYDPRYTGQVGQFRSDFLHKWGY
jgi:acetyl esterase/lipase